MKYLAIAVALLASMQACAGDSYKGLNIVDNEEFKQLAGSDMIERRATEVEQMTKQGYITSHNGAAQELMNANKGIGFDNRFFRAGYASKHAGTEADTYMHPSIHDIKYMFNYQGIESVLTNAKATGAAAAGAYVDGKWSGIAEYFTSSELGNCEVEIFNLSKVHGAVVLNRKTVVYGINNKPTTTAVEGNSQSGFVYSVRWMDGAFTIALRCAAPKLTDGLMDAMTKVAVKLDNAISE